MEKIRYFLKASPIPSIIPIKTFRRRLHIRFRKTKFMLLGKRKRVDWIDAQGGVSLILAGTSNGFDGKLVSLPSRDLIEKTLYYRGEWELDSVEDLAKVLHRVLPNGSSNIELLTKRALFVDLGSHAGLFSMQLFNLLGKKSQMVDFICVEPNPDVLKHLRVNLENFSITAQVVPFALNANGGYMRLVQNAVDSGRTKTFDVKEVNLQNAAVIVQAISYQDFLQKYLLGIEFLFLKIDLEGGEIDFLHFLLNKGIDVAAAIIELNIVKDSSVLKVLESIEDIFYVYLDGKELLSSDLKLRKTSSNILGENIFIVNKKFVNINQHIL